MTHTLPAFTLLAPILVLWVAALVFYVLDRLKEPGDRGIAEAAVLLVSLGLLIGIHTQLDRPLYLAPPVAAASERVPPFLIAGSTTWVLALVLLGSACMAALASLGQPSTHTRAGRLVALGAGMLFLLAGDWATLAMSWVIMDLGLLYALTRKESREAANADATDEGRPPAGESVVPWTAVLSLGSAMALGVALLLWRYAGGGTWVDPYNASGRFLSAPVEPVTTTNLLPWIAALSVIAALVRLMLFPLANLAGADRGRPDSTPAHSPLAEVVLLALPALLGTYLWARLAQWGLVEQSGGWRIALGWCAAAAIIAAGVRAWTASDPHDLVSRTGEYAVGLALLAVGLNLPAMWQMWVGVHVLLSTATLLVGWTECPYLNVLDPRSYWRLLPAACALFSLAGVPFTVGFPVRAGIYKNMFATGQWPLLLLVMIGEALVLGALLRVLFDVERVSAGEQAGESSPTPETEAVSPAEPAAAGEPGTMSQREFRLGAGLVLSLAIVVLGTFRFLPIPNLGFWLGLPTLAIWAALLLPLVGGIWLYRSQETILAVVDEWWPFLRRTFRLGWLYRAIGNVLGYAGTVLWGGTQIVEGGGYMAWVLLFCLVILVFILRG